MILFTADIHINLRHKNVPVDWAVNRYKMYEKQVNEVTKDCDLHIIGGDIFDKIPTMEELAIFFDWVASANVRTLAYAGNHEATKRGQTFLTHLKEAVNKVNPLFTIVDEIYEEKKFVIVPYEFIHKKETWQNLPKDRVVFSHIRGEIEPHVKPEIDLELLADFPVVYLGDLHSHSNCQRNMVYPGSPLTTSFHRNNVSTGCILIDSEDLTKWTWRELKLPQLIRKTVSDPSEMLPGDYDHIIYELEGDVIDLAKVKDTDLLDKKLVKRATDTALILKKDMSIGDELQEYLLYIMELPEEKIKRVITTFHDYTAKNA